MHCPQSQGHRRPHRQSSPPPAVPHRTGQWRPAARRGYSGGPSGSRHRAGRCAGPAHRRAAGWQTAGCPRSSGSKKGTSYIYLRIKALLETIMFIFLIVIGLTLLVFGNGVIELIKEHFNGLKNYNIISSIITEVSFIFVTFIVFLLLYKFMPNHKVTFRSQIYGAIFGAIALNVISFVFSRYLTIFKGFSITYGSLTTLMLIMMWTYSCFYTVFLGAELNKVINKSRNEEL